MWGLPEPGSELVSPALADGFFTTEPPGKAHTIAFLFFKYHIISESRKEESYSVPRLDQGF